MPRLDISLAEFYKKHIAILQGMKLVPDRILEHALGRSYQVYSPEFNLHRNDVGLLAIKTILDGAALQQRRVQSQELIDLVSLFLGRSVMPQRAASAVDESDSLKKYRISVDEFNALIDRINAGSPGKSNKSKRTWVTQRIKSKILEGQRGADIICDLDECLRSAREHAGELDQSFIDKVFSQVRSSFSLESDPKATVSSFAARDGGIFNDIVRQDIDESTKIQLILQRIFSESPEVELSVEQKDMLLMHYADSGIIFHKDVMQQLEKQFNYVPALYALLDVVKGFKIHIAAEKQPAFVGHIISLQREPSDVAELFVRLDQLLQPLASHHHSILMKTQMHECLVALGQAIENTMKITKRDKSEAGFPTDGNYDQIMHHTRLSALNSRLEPFYNTQQRHFMMSLLCYLRFDKPGSENIKIASQLLLDVLANPGIGLGILLSWEKNLPEALLSKQGAVTQATHAVEDQAKRSKESGNTWLGGIFSVLTSAVGKESRLLSCIDLYRACNEAVAPFEAPDSAQAVRTAIEEILLPMKCQYGLAEWSPEDLNSRIKYGAETDAAETLSSASSASTSTP